MLLQLKSMTSAIDTRDLVRRKVTAMGLHLGKLGPNWGPIEKVKALAGYGAYHLETLDGTPKSMEH